MTNLRNKRVAVLGLLKQGLATIRYAHKQGAKTTAFGAASKEGLQLIRQNLAGIEVDIVTDNIPSQGLRDFDVIVITAGVERRYQEALQNAEKEGVTVITDVELACERYRAPIIAVTGSNGKSTVIHMIQKIMENEGKKVLIAGGEYMGFGDTLLNPINADFILLELNSTRLKATRKFRPHIAVFLNLYAGHTERHPSFEDYGKSKAKIFANQTEKDFLIYQVSKDVLKWADEKHVKSQKYPFSYNHQVKRGVYYDPKGSKAVFVSKEGDKETFPLSKIKSYFGPHLIENLLASLMVGKILKISKDSIQKMIDEYKPLEHRMEPVAMVNQVFFVNDAKSVNVAATARALQSFPDHSVILICGGEYKVNQHYPVLKDVLQNKGRILVIFGGNREKFFQKWEGPTETYLVPTLNEAVYLATQKSEPNNVILFSPAAPPEPLVHHTIPNRGKDFKRLVKEQAQLLKHRQYLQTKL